MRTLVGALLWTLFLLTALLLHRREERRRLAEYRGLCRLVQHVREALARAPEPLSPILARFEDEALDRAGFLTELRQKGFKDALASDTLHLEKAELLPFQDYASALGNRLYADERMAIDRLSAEVTAHLSKKEAALPKNERLTGTLFFSGGMLVLLLLL